MYLDHVDPTTNPIFECVVWQPSYSRYLDRFLSVVVVKKCALQLVGITCLILAAKYEEPRAVSLEHFAFLCGNQHVISDLIRMEAQILKRFNYDM